MRQNHENLYRKKLPITIINLYYPGESHGVAIGDPCLSEPCDAYGSWLFLLHDLLFPLPKTTICTIIFWIENRTRIPSFPWQGGHTYFLFLMVQEESFSISLHDWTCCHRVVTFCAVSCSCSVGSSFFGD